MLPRVLEALSEPPRMRSILWVMFRTTGTPWTMQGDAWNRANFLKCAEIENASKGPEVHALLAGEPRKDLLLLPVPQV